MPPNDATRNALLSKLGGGSPLPAPGPAGGPLPPPGAPAPVQASAGIPDGEPINNLVAFHLAEALKALVSGGPEDQENLAALEAFWFQIAELNPESQGAAPDQAPVPAGPAGPAGPVPAGPAGPPGGLPPGQPL